MGFSTSFCARFLRGLLLCLPIGVHSFLVSYSLRAAINKMACRSCRTRANIRSSRRSACRYVAAVSHTRHAAPRCIISRSLSGLRFSDLAKSARSDVYTSLAESWTSFDHPLMDLAAVRYVVVLRSDVAKISIRPEKYTVAYEDNDVVVYQNRDALARARIVHVAKQVSSDSTAQMLAATENGGEAAVYSESAQSVTSSQARSASWSPM